MKRLRRTLFNTLTAISLLLAIAAALLWARSTFYIEQVAWRHNSAETLRVLAFAQGFGSLELKKYTFTSAETKLRESFAPDGGYSSEPIGRSSLIKRSFPYGSGFSFRDESAKAPRMVAHFQSIETPHWFLTLERSAFCCSAGG